MIVRLLDWLRSSEQKRRMASGEKCATCIYFSDFSDTEDDPEEMNGYCTFDYVNGNTWNEYGGHWTNDKYWCRLWKGGEPIWKKESRP